METFQVPGVEPFQELDMEPFQESDMEPFQESDVIEDEDYVVDTLEDKLVGSKLGDSDQVGDVPDLGQDDDHAVVPGYKVEVVHTHVQSCYTTPAWMWCSQTAAVKV